jgi:phospholipase/lecithinase/hemolysin
MLYILMCLVIILSKNLLSNTHLLPFNTIVSFGDDNTDTGNVYNLTNYQWPPVPPYYLGRFSNGPLWIEKLGISQVMNYAYIAATIDNADSVVGFIPPNGTSVPGVRQQILTYLTDIDITTIDLSHTLYVIWAGNNDYLDNSSLTSDFVVSSLINAVYDLVLVGVTNLIIMNQSPLESYPIFHGSDIDMSLMTKIINHNTYLSSNISQIAKLYKISIKVFDLYSLIKTILSNNSTTKLNTINQCWNIINDSIISQCSNPNQYVFIDDYHFTTSIHQTIADTFCQFLSSCSSYYFSFSKLCIFICITVLIINGN